MNNKSQSGMALATSLIVVFLIVALVIGFSWMVLIDQRLGGVNGTETYTFYGAEAGLEKLTGDLGNLFANNSSPSGAQVNALAVAANEPNVPGVNYVIPSGAIGYNITFPVDGSGNPEATDHVIESGNYQGMTGLLTPYTLTVTAHNAVSNAEVRLTRTVQTVAIPVFQFGMFSQTDLSFFPGPNFDFGGNVMTNGNLFLAGGSDLVFNGKVLSAKDIIVTNLSNGWPTSNNYTGQIYAPTTSGGCPSGTWPTGSTAGCQQLTQGSLVGTIGSAQNAAFPNLAKSTYNSYIGSTETGVKPVNLSITLAPGANPIDLIRRPVAGENASNPDLYSQRYYAQASMRIMLSDNQADLDSLPCVDTTHNALQLSAQTTGTLGGVPIAESGAVNSAHTALAAGANYVNSSNGYWEANGQALITGYIKIEIQTSYPTTAGSCGTWKDVTSTVLALGIAGRNLNPNKNFTLGTNSYYSLPALFPQPGSSPSSTGQIAASTCADPSSTAIIRLERLRDNPSTGTAAAPCGTTSTVAFDYWPNLLFDTREGNLRDLEPSATTVADSGGTKGTFAYYQMPTLGGVMNYTELDIKDLATFLTTNATGMLAKDSVNSTNDFTIYFSDRRGNYTPAAMPGGWPPLSPGGYETGEYGFEDSINPSSGYGCPDGTLDNGETFDMVENPGNQVVGGTPEDYGETSPSWPVITTNGNAVYTTYFTDLWTNKGIIANPNCNPSAGLSTSAPWPGAYIVNPQEARENPPMFFRRALKLVNGSSISLGTCPDGVVCGLTIVSENPVYVQGDFNAAAGSDVNSTPTQAHVATSVIADSVTLLSDSWNDVNSFIFPYYSGSCPNATGPPQGGAWGTCGRNSTTTNYRLAVVAGKGISFPQPSTCGTGACYDDFGTDGGVHNFLRYVEDWGAATLYYRGSVVSFYYSRQGIGVYKDGLNNTVYSPPTRGYQFDSDFLTPSLLPPRTPMFRDVNTVGFTQVVLPSP